MYCLCFDLYDYEFNIVLELDKMIDWVNWFIKKLRFFFGELFYLYFDRLFELL